MTIVETIHVRPAMYAVRWFHLPRTSFLPICRGRPIQSQCAQINTAAVQCKHNVTFVRLMAKLKIGSVGIFTALCVWIE